MFELTVPERSAPLLVEIPHAGLWIPQLSGQLVTVARDAVLRDADIYVDELYKDAADHGACRLAAKVSRYVVDLNRSASDIDPSVVEGSELASTGPPRGVVWRATTDGHPVLDRPLTASQLAERLALFHAPYHRALRRTLDHLKKRHGHVILLAAHSMPSRGRSRQPGSAASRADIVPGSLGRTSAAPSVIDAVDAYFRGHGLTVAHDDPYRGGYSTRHYGQPDRGVHAIQIEINRALYVDERTFKRTPQRFERLRNVLDGLVRELASVIV